MSDSSDNLNDQNDPTGYERLKRALEKEAEAYVSSRSTELFVYDLETTIPATDVIEFGAVVLRGHDFQELGVYETLLKSEKITKRSTDCNHITKDMVKSSPSFADIADKVFDLMDGRIWVGYNILKFDNRRIEEQFEKLNRKAPVAAAHIDLLPLFRDKFGKRAGDLKLASLMTYYGLGVEAHRAVDDCRQLVAVFKRVAMTLFLEQHCDVDLNKPPMINRDAESSVSDASTAPNTTTQKHAESASPSSSPNKTVADSTPDAPPSTSGENAPTNWPKKEIVTQIDALIKAKSGQVTMIYDGGSNANQPRSVTITKWVNRPHMVQAMCHISETLKHFASKRIVELRETEAGAATVSKPTKSTKAKSTSTSTTSTAAKKSKAAAAAASPSSVQAPLIGHVFESVDEAKQHVRLLAPNRLMFVGFSGSGYKNESGMLDIVRAELSPLNRAQWIIGAGGSVSGIGAIYALAAEMGFNTYGVVSSKALSGVAMSSKCKELVYVQDETWGGWLDSNTTQLSPTSDVLVSTSSRVIALGGGSVAVAELTAAMSNGIPVRVFNVEAAKANKKGAEGVASEFAGVAKAQQMRGDLRWLSFLGADQVAESVVRTQELETPVQLNYGHLEWF